MDFITEFRNVTIRADPFLLSEYLVSAKFNVISALTLFIHQEVEQHLLYTAQLSDCVSDKYIKCIFSLSMISFTVDIYSLVYCVLDKYIYLFFFSLCR